MRPGPVTSAESDRIPAFGAQLLRQPLDHQPVGRVDGLPQLVVRDAGEGEVVPSGAPDVAHHGRAAGIALEPLVGHVAASSGLDPDAGAAEESEDLAPLPRADLEHRVVVLPREVRPGTGLGLAVGAHPLDVHGATSWPALVALARLLARRIRTTS